MTLISVGFSFDDKVLPGILEKIMELKEMFNLNNDTKIYLGPKDSNIGGKKHKTIFVGTLKELMK